MKRYFILALLIGGCAHQEGVNSNSTQKTKLNVVVASNRFAESEPCGCALEDLGGMVREYELYRSIRSEGGRLLNFTVGTTFLPAPNVFESTQLKHYQMRFMHLSKMLESLGVSAISPSKEDLLLGTDRLSKTRLPLVSANLKRAGALVFAPFKIIQSAGQEIFVTGLASRQTDPKYGTIENIEVESPRESLARLLTPENTRGKLVVLLSSLSETELTQIAELLPQVHLLLGGKLDETTSGVAQRGPTLLQLNPPPRGRVLARVEIDRTPVGNETFSNPFITARAISARSRWKLQLDGPLSLERRREIKIALQLASKLKMTTESVPVGFDSQSIPLNADFEPRSNPVSELIDNYRKETRDIAISEIKHGPISPP